ncbi:MAG: dihydropyrimidinase [Nitrospinota bacterium]
MEPQLDLMIRNGAVVTVGQTYRADVGIANGKIVRIGEDLSGAAERAQIYDASGKWVLPGAIDVHTHFDMPLPTTRVSDDFRTGTTAAACGGVTSVIDFAIQERGDSLSSTLDNWMERAHGKAVVDYGFHMTVTDARPEILDELPRLREQGVTTLKVLMAYKGTLMQDDASLYRILERARKEELLVLVHCENGEVIDVRQKQFVAEGKLAPVWHPRSRPPILEGEATGRAIDLATLAGTPLYIVHLTCRDALERVQAARARGLPTFAETCPQYLVLDESLIDTPDFEGAKFVCSPPLRHKSHQEFLWAGLRNGFLSVVGSDHAPFNYRRQKELGRESFLLIPNGLPGSETIVPILYSEGVRKGRITLNDLVALVSANPARLFGMYPEKGTLAVGSDADMFILDPEKRVVLGRETLHHRVDYSPYEGMEMQGVVVATLSRGVFLYRDGEVTAPPGHGRFLVRRRSAAFEGLAERADK